jgi:WD40 repeat protein
MSAAVAVGLSSARPVYLLPLACWSASLCFPRPALLLPPASGDVCVQGGIIGYPSGNRAIFAWRDGSWKSLPFDLNPTAVIPSPDGSSAVTIEDRRFLTLWRLPQPRLIWRKEMGHSVSAEFLPRGDSLLVRSSEGLSLLELPGGRRILHRPTRGTPLSHHLQFTADGRYLLTQDAGLCVFDLKLRSSTLDLPASERVIWRSAPSPDGALLATADTSGTVVIRDAGTGRELRRFESGRARTFARIDWLGPDEFLLWNNSGWTLLGQTDPPLSVSLGPDEFVQAVAPAARCLIASKHESSPEFKSWTVLRGLDGGEIRRFPFSHAVRDFSSDGRRAIVGHSDSQLQLLDCETGDLAPVPSGWWFCSDGCSLVTFSEGRLIRRSFDGSILQRSSELYRQVDRLRSHRLLAQSPEGAWIVDPHTFRREKPARLGSPSSSPLDRAWALPDGTIATFDDYFGRLWIEGEDAPRASGLSHADYVCRAALLLPRTSRLLTWDIGRVRLYDAASGRLLAEHLNPDLNRYRFTCHSSVSPDETRVLFPTTRGSVILDLPTGRTTPLPDCVDGAWSSSPDLLLLLRQSQGRRTLSICDSRTLREIQNEGPIDHFYAFDQLVLARFDQERHLLELPSGRVLSRHVRDDSGSVFVGKGPTLAIAETPERLVLLRRGECLFRAVSWGSRRLRFDFSPLLSATWEPPQRELQIHGLDPSGAVVATFDGNLAVWRLPPDDH